MFTVESGSYRDVFSIERQAFDAARALSEQPVDVNNTESVVNLFTVDIDQKQLIARFCDGMLIWLNGEEIS